MSHTHANWRSVYSSRHHNSALRFQLVRTAPQLKQLSAPWMQMPEGSSERGGWGWIGERTDGRALRAPAWLPPGHTIPSPEPRFPVCALRGCSRPISRAPGVLAALNRAGCPPTQLHLLSRGLRGQQAPVQRPRAKSSPPATGPHAR